MKEEVGTFGLEITLERRLEERSTRSESANPVPAHHNKIKKESYLMKSNKIKILTNLANTLKFFIIVVIASQEEGAINSYKTCHYFISNRSKLFTIPVYLNPKGIAFFIHDVKTTSKISNITLKSTLSDHLYVFHVRGKHQ